MLVVEDEESVRKLARRALEAQAILCCTQPSEGGAGGRGAPPGQVDLLITDVMMPEFTGRQLADRVTAPGPAVNVLYMSGYAEDAIVHQGRLELDTAFLQKPFSPDTLAHTVRAILDRHGDAAAAHQA